MIQRRRVHWLGTKACLEVVEKSAYYADDTSLHWLECDNTSWQLH